MKARPTAINDILEGMIDVLASHSDIPRLDLAHDLRKLRSQGLSQMDLLVIVSDLMVNYHRFQTDHQ